MATHIVIIQGHSDSAGRRLVSALADAYGLRGFERSMPSFAGIKPIALRTFGSVPN